MRPDIAPDFLSWQVFPHMGTDCLSLCQDREGALWCGSASGLCRYDGKLHRYYEPRDGLPEGHVAHILSDNEDRLWMGTHALTSKPLPNTLARLERDAIRIFGPSDGWPGWHVTGLSTKRNGAWIAARGGIALVEGDRFRIYTRSDGLLSQNVNCIITRHDESVWAGTDFGLVVIDGGHIRHFTTADGLPSKPVLALAEDTRGRLWIGLTNGLACYDGKVFHLWTVRDGLTTVPVHALCVDPQDRVWTGSYSGQGACCFDGESFVPITTASGMPHNSVSHMLADHEGGMVFACNHGGVARMDVTGIALVSDEPVPEAACMSRDGRLWWAAGTQVMHCKGFNVHTACRATEHVTALRLDRHARLWIGTVSALYVADSDAPAVRPRQIPTGDLHEAQIRSICEDPSGSVWVATKRQGAYIYEDMEDRAFRVGSLLDTAPVSKMMIDSRGRIWASDWVPETDGVWVQDGRKKTRYTTEDGLPDNRATCMFEDAAGHVWIGSLGGLAVFDGLRFRTFGPEDGVVGRTPQCIMQDRRGQLWIGFLGGGVSRYDGRNFQVLTMQDGLPSDRVTGIFETQAGTIMITTYKGVCRYTPDDASAPSIRIDAVETDRSHNFAGLVRMTDSVPVLRIRFHGTSMKTRRMRYTYIMDGFDNEWRSTWDQEVGYVGLPPGSYTFRVVAINRDLVYSAVPAEARIEVTRDPREQRLNELEHEVRTLEGLLPICSVCKRIRNDRNEWEQMEVYVSRRSGADFSHGYCPTCAEAAARDIQRTGGLP